MSLLIVSDKIWEDRNVSRRELSSSKGNGGKYFYLRTWLKAKAISPLNFSGWQNILEVWNCFSTNDSEGGTHSSESSSQNEVPWERTVLLHTHFMVVKQGHFWTSVWPYRHDCCMSCIFPFLNCYLNYLNCAITHQSNYLFELGYYQTISITIYKLPSSYIFVFLDSSLNSLKVYTHINQFIAQVFQTAAHQFCW